MNVFLLLSYFKRRSLLLVFILFAVIGQPAAQLRTFNGEDGRWTVVSFGPNITRVSYHPKGYTNNEQITGAVKARPLMSLPIRASLQQGGLLLDNGMPMNIQPLPAQDGFRGLRFQLKPGEQIFGGGERALPLNRRGYRLPLYNNPWYGYSNGADALNFSVPFFTSSAGYGLFFDNGSKGYADIGKSSSNQLDVGFVSGELTVYIITGRSYADILSSYFKLTGTQPLPPRWALGNYMSRFGYTSEAQTFNIAGKMRDAGIPFDAIIFDLFWFGDSIKNTLGNLDWMNREKWPDPKGMIAKLGKQQVQSVLIAEPFILKGTRTYPAAVPYLATDSAGAPFTLQDFYFGYGGLLDIFRKDAGNWIWNTHYRKQIDNGVHAWWTDLGEPEKHPAALQHNLRDQGVQRLMGADEVHNLYGHYWNRMLAEKYQQYFPAKRLFHLNRSGFAGSQRYSIFPWSGDVSRSWSGLQAQLPLMLGMSMSGIPYIHADAGGFAGGEGDHELYVRWLQFAVYTPVFRPHGTALFGVDPNAFNYPSEPALIDTPYRWLARQAVYQRYRMLPYNYTLAWRHTQFAEPLVAPLYFHFPADTTATHIQDQFMWGQQLLVAPVIEKEQRVRRLYLPAGNWYDLHKGLAIAGGQWITRETPLDETPVYVKAGSFLPLWMPDTMANVRAGEYNGRELSVLYYPSDLRSSYTLYDDDGVSRNSSSEKLTFTANKKNNQLVINISTSEPARYRNGRQRKLRLAFVGASSNNQAVLVNGKPFILNNSTPFSFNASPGFTAPGVELVFKGKPLTVRFQPNVP